MVDASSIAGAALIANASGDVPSATQRPFSLSIIYVTTGGVTGGVTTFQDSIQVPTDSDFICTRLMISSRSAASGANTYGKGLGYVAPGSTTTAGPADPGVLIQIRDSGTQGQGMFDRPTDARLVNGGDNGDGRLARPMLFKAGNSIAIEGTWIQTYASAINLHVVLFGYRDYSKPSQRR